MYELTGVATEVWGPKAWGFLHAVAFRYPDPPKPQDRKAMHALLQSLGRLLPCKKCRAHYVEYLAANGVTSPEAPLFADREALARWLVDLHNSVNRRLGKTELPFEAVREMYSGDYVCPADPGSMWAPRYSAWAVVMAVGCAVILLAAVMYWQRNRHRSELELLAALVAQHDR